MLACSPRVGPASFACVIATAPALADEKAFSCTHDAPELAWMESPPLMPEACGLAVLQRHPAEYHADVFFPLPAGTTAPRHWRTSAEGMVLIAGELHIGYDDQHPVVIAPGTCAYGPAELPHDASFVSDETATQPRGKAKRELLS